MAKEEPVEVDPEALADPLEDEDGGRAEDPSAGDRPAETTALVSSEGRALAPADPFRRYLAEVRKYPPLSREEERDLARQYRETGDRQALFRLVTANLMLVVRVALSFRRAARNLLDLIQEGNIGLLQAIERFDPELGVRLPTYAAWWIRAYMVKFLLDNVRLVRVGTTNVRRRLLHNLAKEKKRLEERGFEVGPKLLAERFGATEEDVRDVQQALGSRDVSLDAPLGEDEEATHGDVFPSSGESVEEEVARREMQRRAEAAISRFREGLDERDKVILSERILSEDPKTLQALGDRFGITREAVRQAEAKLMKKLTAYLKEELGDLGKVHIGPA
jgi:RNA polymerase sigma-32 factor